MENLTKVWTDISSNLYRDMTDTHFNTWIRPLTPMKIIDRVFYINAPITLVKKIVKEKYMDSIEAYAKTYLGEDIKVEVIDPKDAVYQVVVNNISFAENGQANFINDSDEDDKPTKTAKSEEQAAVIENSYLNPRYTFNNFVKGKSNEFALAVAQNIVENPGTKYNPFFIYGGSGLGKTHLMQAIGNKILENTPNARVLYISSENFMNEFISTITDSKNSIGNSQIFRNKYRNADVLMIDDIQFIAGKEGTQEEIFHTFNSLIDAKKQIILTSDKKPDEIKNLEHRLVTRFSGGILADIQHPDFETRVAILNHKIKIDRIKNVPNVVIEFIANNVTTNIRELEGSMLKVMAYFNVHFKDRDDITDDEYLDVARQALSIKEKKKKVVTIDLIMDMVTSTYELEKGDLISKNRKKNIAMSRHIAMYLSRKLTDLSLVKIGERFERDHSTVMNAIDNVKLKLDEDPAFKKELNELIIKIRD